jgi:hypothetical protein
MLSWAFLPSRVLPFSSGSSSVLSVTGLRSSHGLGTSDSLYRLTRPFRVLPKKKLALTLSSLPTLLGFVAFRTVL